jgi:hypothetical protein
VKLRLFAALLFISTALFAQTTKINVSGFGELTAVQKGSTYTIKIGDYGSFDFKGTTNPLNLKAKVSIEKLQRVPGYIVLSNLGLQNITLNISSKGLKVKALADTKKNLNMLCEMLKVTSPTVEIEAKIGINKFELSGELAFSEEPIQLLYIEQTGTELSYSSAKLGTAVNFGSAEITVESTVFIKPTDQDPSLKVIYTFGYDLILQKITGAGSMVSKWADPFGMDNFVKKNSIIFDNAAMQIDYIIGSPSPTGIGFAIERCKMFNLDFGLIVSIAPADKQIAFLAERESMTLNDVSTMMREGFGLRVPDIFPDNYYLKDAKIKFAPFPEGGQVGKVKIDKGFLLEGRAKIGDALEGDLKYYFDMKNKFKLHIDFDADFKKFVMNEAKKIKFLKDEIENVLDMFQVKSLYIDMNASLSDLDMNGKFKSVIAVSGKEYPLKFKATLDAKEIAKQLVDEIIEIAAGENVQKAYKGAMDIANGASKEAGKLLADAKTISKHTHSKETCDEKCVPAHAKKLSQPIVEGSYDAVRKFYYNTFPEIGQIHGNTPQETREIRSKLIKSSWDQIFVKIDDDWEKIRNDRTYVLFYIKQSSAENGGKIYRAKIKEYRNKDVEYRKKVWEMMMVNTSTGKERAKIKGTTIPKGTYYVKSVKAGSSDNGYFDIAYNHDKKGWKIKGQRLEIWTRDDNDNKKFKFHSNNYLSYYIITPASDSHYALDCKGAGREKGTPIHLWSLHKKTSQQFYFKHIENGKFAIIPRGNQKLCLALVDNDNADKGNKIHLWTYSDASSKQWYLINAKTGKRFIPDTK